MTEDKPLTENDEIVTSTCSCGEMVENLNLFNREDVLSAVRLLKKKIAGTGFTIYQCRIIHEDIDKCFQLEAEL